MKKILRVVAITSTVMVVILGAFLWNMNRLSKQKAAKQEKLLVQERDLLPDSRQKAIDKVEKVNIKQLYLSGDNKNVVTVPSTGLQQVYDGSQSTKAEEMLTTVKKNKQFSFDKPLWAYNPYGTNEINVLIYDTAENKVVLNEKNLDCSASIPRDDSSHVVLLEKDGKTALFNMLDKTFSGWDKPEMDPDESLGWDDIKACK